MLPLYFEGAYFISPSYEIVLGTRPVVSSYPVCAQVESCFRGAMQADGVAGSPPASNQAAACIAANTARLCKKISAVDEGRGEENGARYRTRTCDLYRVKVAF